MEDRKRMVAIYHATPLCRKCNDEVSQIERASEKAGAGIRIQLSLWKRIRFGLRFLRMPVVVIDNKPFSVLGAFQEEALIAELKRSEKESLLTGR